MPNRNRFKIVLGGVAVAPVNTVAPSVTGTAVVGQTLTGTNGTWTGSPTSYSYQWYRGATLITGATSSSYTLVQADAGNTSNIKCTVTASNGLTASADSNTVAQVLTARTNSFLTASSITDSTIRGALNTFDIGLISNSLDTKMKALYPFVGGTASTHKFNFMDARDLDASFRLVFNGSWTHSSTGALPNGTNAFANTFLRPNNSLSLNSVHLSYYSRTNQTFTDVLLGAADASYNNGLYLLPKNAPNNEYTRINQSTFTAPTGHPNTFGFFNATRTVSTESRSYRNGGLVNILAVSSSGLSSNTIYIGSANISPQQYTSCECAFSSIGDGLNATEVSTFYNLVQAMQTTLGRQV